MNDGSDLGEQRPNFNPRLVCPNLGVLIRDSAIHSPRVDEFRVSLQLNLHSDSAAPLQATPRRTISEIYTKALSKVVNPYSPSRINSFFHSAAVIFNYPRLGNGTELIIIAAVYSSRVTVTSCEYTADLLSGPVRGKKCFEGESD